MPKTPAHKTGFDVVVIGGGSAGLSAAFAARQEGASVAIVSSDKLGGECPNYACVPTKSMLAAAVRYDDIRRNGARFGIDVKRLTFNLPAMMERKDAVVNAMTGGRRLEKILEKEKVTIFRGAASFIDDESIRVGTHIISAKSFVIATGSVPKIPPIAGIDSVDYWTPREATSITELPESIAILGSGPIGCEFATFFSLLGIPVIVFDIADRLLPREDAETAALAAKTLMHRGVTFHGDTRVLGVAKTGRQIRITFQTKSEPRKTVRVERLLIASGRVPNVESLGLENAGVKRNATGRMLIDSAMRIKGQAIFLAGDVSGLPAYTHTAHHEGAIAGKNAALLAQGKKKFASVDLAVVPRVTFVAPELASVGAMPDELVAKKKSFTVWKFPVGALGRAVIESERIGLLKVFVEKRSYLILGASMLGDRSGEVIHELALAMFAGLTIDTVQSMIHAYPTMSEAIPGLMPS
ncbi:MAG: NAD(P)/FAD-dependent oxidoreductase [Patescibacteria group bacterium]